MRKFIFNLSLSSCSLFLLSGCATILVSKNAQVMLYGGTGLKVSENGESISIEKVHWKSRATESTMTRFYAPGISLDRTQSHTVVIASGDRAAEVVLKSKMSTGWIIANLFTSGPIGIIIDASTKKGKTLKPRFIDVEAVLNGTKPLSKRKMKKGLKRAALGKKVKY